jgi:hypothetical protein
MTKKQKRSEPFVMLPLSLLTSDAWGSLGLNAKRFIEFLMIEHMRHGGRANRKLLAPRRQLERFGIGSHFISSAIDNCERVGLVDCHRGFGRYPSRYALTWLPPCDGGEPSNRFLGRCEAAQDIIAARKASKRRKSFQKLPTATFQTAVATSDCSNDSRSDCQTAVTKPVVTVQTAATSGGAKQQHLSRKFLTTAKPKGCAKSEGVGVPPGDTPADAARDAQTGDQPNRGKPNGTRLAAAPSVSSWIG